MSRATYAISALLALFGTGTAVAGIIWGEAKPIGIGLVLMFGGLVFALLYLGTRRKPPHAALASSWQEESR
jgi:hypothetical protein